MQGGPALRATGLGLTRKGGPPLPGVGSSLRLYRETKWGTRVVGQS